MEQIDADTMKEMDAVDLSFKTSFEEATTLQEEDRLEESASGGRGYPKYLLSAIWGRRTSTGWTQKPCGVSCVAGSMQRWGFCVWRSNDLKKILDNEKPGAAETEDEDL
ncbi:hypothetical protein LTR09_003699 [Extremus antarcticus]|uniref:Uncharacterized protein n=1 Tax=Extremus antarcticus TaxID=702011 RepID=A0AAJ0DS06_9PEZI|nr:hypothetical protein LTR09_003699 [Extremus antarcticus]